MHVLQWLGTWVYFRIVNWWFGGSIQFLSLEFFVVVLVGFFVVGWFRLILPNG